MAELDLEDVNDELLGFCWSNLSPRDRAKLTSDYPKTLWLFGAGASHHYNLNAGGVPVPLADDFFEAFGVLPTIQSFRSHVGPFVSFLRDYRGVQAEDVSRWHENIEAFMTSVEDGINTLKVKMSEAELTLEDRSRAIDFSTVFNNMSFIFACVVNETQNGPSDSLYRYLLDFCGPNDAFMTFNWDTLLDRALLDTGGWSPNDGYGLNFASVLDGTWKKAVEGTPSFGTNWKLLKLHGSTNWLVPATGIHVQTLDYVSAVPESDSIFLYWQSTLPFGTHKDRWRGGYVPTCYGYYPPNLPTQSFSHEQLSAPPGKAFVKVTPWGIFSPFEEPDSDGVPSSPVLITPVRQKKYDIYQRTINSLWNQSADFLAKIDRVVIIGYSFPLTDVRSLDLLESALTLRNKEITVEFVAPDASTIASRIGERALSKAKTVECHNMKFEDYIGLLGKTAPDRMRKAANDFTDVFRWIERHHVIQTASAAGWTPSTINKRINQTRHE